MNLCKFPANQPYFKPHHNFEMCILFPFEEQKIESQSFDLFKVRCGLGFEPECVLTHSPVSPTSTCCFSSGRLSRQHSVLGDTVEETAAYLEWKVVFILPFITGRNRRQIHSVTSQYY